MIDDAIVIFDYLPITYSSVQEEEYIKFLWDSFTSNYENGKYQFAYIAYHMMFMSSAYYKLWQIKHFKRSDFEKAMVGFNKDIEKEILDSDSIFTFSKINESIIFRFLKIVGCDNSEIGNFTKLVKDRNAIAHSNGNIFYNDQKSIDEKINEILDLLNKIQIFFKDIIEENYKLFLTDNEDPETWEFSEANEELNQILIHKNKFSKEDIRFCLDLDVSDFKKEGHISLINELKKNYASDV